MKVATFNVNSIRARLERVLSWLEAERPDVLCLQETKVQDREFPFEAFIPAGYQAAFRGQKAYNGVAALSREPLSDLCLFLQDQEEEARFLAGSLGPVRILDVYVPQGVAPETEKFRYKLAWLDALLGHLRSRCSPDAPLLILGDFNVALEPRDVYDPEALKGQVGFHPEEQERMRRLLDWGLVDVFRRLNPDPGHYTFWDYRIPHAVKRRMGWRIDYILATRPLADKVRRTWVDLDARLQDKPSDHTFLTAEFEDLDRTSAGSSEA